MSFENRLAKLEAIADTMSHGRDDVAPVFKAILPLWETDQGCPMVRVSDCNGAQIVTGKPGESTDAMIARLWPHAADCRVTGSLLNQD